VLQDPHTVVATLDPLRAFGPSAFGALHVRAIFPPRKRSDSQATSNPADTASEDDSSSNWLPLGTLVRLPQLTTLQCPSEPTALCTLSGSSLYLIDAIAPTPAFENPALVPDGYTGATLSVPRPAAAGTLFLKLRDDPKTVNAASIPSPAPAPRPTTTARVRHSASASPASGDTKSDKSDSAKSDSTKSDTTKPDVAKPDNAKPDSTSTKPSDITPQSTPETHAHKDGSPQDDTTPPPSDEPPTATPKN